MNITHTLPLMTAFLVAQAGSPPALPHPRPAASQAQPASASRPRMVEGSAQTINYQAMKQTTEIDMVGSPLAPKASGEARVMAVRGGLHLTATFQGLPPASTFGGEVMTYVLWGISPEGRATNLGEVLFLEGKGGVRGLETRPAFALIVTAEPYFAVTQPSDVRVLESATRKGSLEPLECTEVRYELLPRGHYTQNLEPLAPWVTGSKTPPIVFQARNAVRIARASGALAYAPEVFGKAVGSLAQAEIPDRPLKAQANSAREAVQRSEDARLIAIQKQEGERVATELKATQSQLELANEQVAQASVAETFALKQNRAAEHENDSLRARNDGLRTQNTGLAAQNDGLQTKNAGLQAQLMTQLNAVLKTRATARGLIVNMSGVLFQNGKADLLPAAREKLAKVAGILSTHKGLRIEAEGFTDSNGSEASNQRLSEKRAENARNFLVKQGVPSKSISFQGFGEGVPIATNDTDAGRQENRRVELVVSGGGLTPSTPGGAH